MIHYQRNTEDLKRAIREHSIAGYPLNVPSPFVSALGISTISIPRLTTVVAQIDPPIHFQDLAKYRDWKPHPHNLKWWVDYTVKHRLPHSEENPLKWMHPHSRAALEDGYEVSEQSIQAKWLSALGHMDSEDFIKKFSFDINSVTMPVEALRPGMIVDFFDAQSRQSSFPGRVIGVELDSQDGSPVVLLESFEPVPALLAPKALAPWMIDPSYVPNKTWALGYGTYQAMKKKRIKIPTGMFDPKDEKQRVYFLDQPMPLSKVQNFCEKYYPKAPECVWQSMVFLVLPIHPKADAKKRHQGGFFRPYPDDTQTTDIEAQIDYFTEGMEFEE